MNSNIIFTYSPWYIVLCVLVGVGYAYLMYQRPGTFTSTQRRGLAVLRATLVSIICFLLLNPLFRREESKVIPPTAVIALDNSTSVKRDKPEEIRSKVRELMEALQAEGLEVGVETLDGENVDEAGIDEIPFNVKTTNLSQLLGSLTNKYEGSNLTDVILLSDGIANAGISPAFANYPFRVSTLGVGDTTRSRDVRILGIYANQVAYLGNSFPIEAEVSGFGYRGQAATVVLKKGDAVIDRQIVRFDTDDDIKRVNFTTKQEQQGIQRYRVEVLPLGGESSTVNNRQDVYIEVIDGKEKVLLLALAPHPDIKALKSIIEKSEVYELTIKIVSTDNVSGLADTDFDILLLHQLPDKSGRGRALLPALLARNKPTFFILGGQSDITAFNGMQQALGINPQGGKTDLVTAAINPSFKQFTLTEGQTDILRKFPEMNVPYGDYSAAANSDIILWQQVGSVVTTRPLLLVNTNADRKTAVLAGEGIWRWRLEEYDLTDTQYIVDDIISKTIQLISVKDDKRKLRVYPTANTYGPDDRVIFENEVYNNIYERIYDQPIALEITNERGEKKNYDYTITSGKSTFEVAGLPAGVYRYQARANVLGKTETANGQFIVTDIALEDINTTADFGLLRTLSQDNGGVFATLPNLQGVIDFLKSNKSPGKIISTETVSEVISMRWLLVLLLLMATIEWILRKYYGTY